MCVRKGKSEEKWLKFGLQVTMDDVNANEFLTIKSTEQQKKEGVEHPVDTAFVEEHNGQLILKAVFDVHHFKPEEVSLKVAYILHLFFAFALNPAAANLVIPFIAVRPYTFECFCYQQDTRQGTNILYTSTVDVCQNEPPAGGLL